MFTKTSLGERLIHEKETASIARLRKLWKELNAYGKALIVDCHSFSSDPFCTPGAIVKVNSPFSGALVPMRYYLRDRRVMPIMLEV